MTKPQVEHWALNVVDRVKKSQPIEDSRVEAKAQWIESPRAARRLAGHANSARGEPILWLIGIDEQRGVVGADSQELATWWSQVKSQFDEVEPRLAMDVVLSVDGKSVVALLLDTDRFPYVIKNFAGGQIQFEVPWREGTMVRSARRTDLVRLIAPLQPIPQFEVLKGFLRANVIAEDMLGWFLELPLYVVAQSEAPVIIPYHRCRVEIEVPSVLSRTHFEKVYLEPVPKPQPSLVLSKTVQASSTEIIVERAGMAKLTGYGKSSMPISKAEVKEKAPAAAVTIALLSAHAEHPIIISELFPDMTQEEEQWGLWKN